MAKLLRSLINQDSYFVGGEYPTVSLEEAAILEAQAASDVVEADATMDEVENLQQKADVLSDTADYIETSVNTSDEGPTQNEVVLAEQVADAATAGTGQTSEDLLPAVESYIGRGSQIALEGIRETIRNFWETIKRGIEKIWNLLKRYYRSMTSRLSSVVKSAKELKEKADKNTSKSPGDTKKVKVSATSVGLLSADSKISNAAAIQSNLDALINHADHALNEWTKAVVAAGKGIAENMKDLDEDNSVEKLEAINEKVKTILTKLPSNYSTSQDTRFAEKDVILESSPVLAGDRRLFIKKKNPPTKDLAMAVAAQQQYTEWFMTSATSKEKDYEETEIDLMTPNATSKLAQTILNACDKFRNYAEGRGFEDLQKQSEAIRKAGDTAAAKVGKLENRANDEDDKINKERSLVIRRLRSAQSYAQAYAKWAKNPTVTLTNHTLSVMRAAITVGNSSMAKYS